MNNASILSGQFIVLFSLINNGHKKLQISLHEHSTNQGNCTKEVPISAKSAEV